MTVQEDTRTRIGLHLAGLEVQSSALEAGLPQRAAGLFPPALILPEGEHSPRVHLSGRLPVEGAGLAWSGARQAQEAPSERRIPLPTIWRSFQAGDAILEGAPIGPAEALALVIQELIPQEGFEDSEVCIDIPNTLTEARQQDLIDACGRIGIELVMLWRPVAAALSWLREFRPTIRREIREETSLGGLLTVHLGVEGFEVGWIELIQRPEAGDWVFPARRRPSPEDRGDPKLGRNIVEAAARSAVAKFQHQGDLLQAWRLLWASPAARQGIQRNGQPTDCSAWGVPDQAATAFPEEVARAARTLLLSGAASGSGADWLSRQRPPEGLPSLVGAIATGELADVRLDQGTLGHAVVRALAPSLRDRILVEGVTSASPSGTLARSAVEYADRRARSLPTYLDTLPRIEVLTSKGALPEWTSLLQEDEQFVPGGQVWEREQPLGPLYVKAHSETLELTVWMDSEDVVKQVTATFPTPPRKKVEVGLRARIEPARGVARVEVRPVNEGALGRRYVTLDWRHAIQTGQSKEDHLKKVDEICPPAQLREAWPYGWRKVARLLGRFVDNAPTHWTARGLASLRDSIRNAKPTGSQVPMGKSGISSWGLTDSNGQLAARQAHNQRIVDHFVENAASALMAGSLGYTVAGEILGCLGYLSAKSDTVEELVDWYLTESGPYWNRDECVFLGGCIRTEHHCKLFVDQIIHALNDGQDKHMDRLKALAQVLQTRETALRDVGDSAALRLARQCIDLVASGVAPRLLPGWTGGRPRLRFKYKERYPLIIVVFLLRRRLYQEGFLDPDSPIGKHIQAVLGEGIKAIREHRLVPMGGVVTAEQVMHNVCEYIHGRGTPIPSWE